MKRNLLWIALALATAAQGATLDAGTSYPPELKPVQQEAEAAYPKIMAWGAGIGARPAVVKALAAVDVVRTKTTQFDKASEDAKDRTFGRGRYTATA